MNAATTADTEDAKTGIIGVVRRAFSVNTLGPLAALVLACLFFSIKSDRFFTGGNFSLIVQQVMVVGTLAIGQTLVILTAGIDLSNGAVMALGNIVMTKLAVDSGLNPFLAILLGLIVCAGFGLLNGGLVTTVRLPPFIVTLGTLNIAFALTHIYSNEQTVSNLPSALTWFGNTFSVGQTDITYGSRLSSQRPGSSCARPPQDGMSTPSATNPKQRVSAVSQSGACCWWSIPLLVSSMASLPGCWFPVRRSATPTPAKPTIWTASPLWFLAAPAFSAAAETSSAL
jgi:hypothetical protein